MEMDNRNLTGLAERIRELRRARGLSQEELADQVGVSRQAVSKWEGDQILPELDKVLALSLLFETSTDYLLKGERPARRNQPDARIFAIVATALNAVGLILSAIGWSEEQTASGAGGGWIVMAMGCMIFAVGRTLGEGNACRQADKIFWPLNLWLLAPVLLAALAWGLLRFRLGGDFSFAKEWIQPRVIVVSWAIYLLLCALGDVWILQALKKKAQK